MPSLQLTVPAATSGRSIHWPLHPGALREQLAALPHGDMSRAMQETLELAYGLNRAVVPAVTRVALQEQFRGPYRLFHHYYRCPPAPSFRAAVRKPPQTPPPLRDLTREMAFGYKLAALELSRRRALWSRDKMLLVSLQGALRFLSLELIGALEQHRPQVPNLWREIHQLYAYAERQRLHRRAPPGAEADAAAEALSVESIYKQTLLAALADPYALAPGLIWDLYGYLERWSRETELFVATAHPGRAETCFRVELDGLIAARLGNDEADSMPTGQTRFLDAEPLAVLAAEHAALLRGGQRPDTPEPALPDLPAADAAGLLARARQGWRPRRAPRAERRPRSGWVEAVVGLASCHQLLLAAVPQTPTGRLGTGAAANPTLGGVVPSRWSLVNESTTGVSATVGVAQDLRVGQLVLLGLPGTPLTAGRWQLGDLRWLHGLGAETYRLGVRFLSTGVEAATVCAATGPALDTREQPALLATLTDAMGGALVMLTRHGQFRCGRDLRLRRAGVTTAVRPTALLEYSAEFDCFQFVELPG